jgi:hypothetical protein
MFWLFEIFTNLIIGMLLLWIVKDYTDIVQTDNRMKQSTKFGRWSTIYGVQIVTGFIEHL